MAKRKNKNKSIKKVEHNYRAVNKAEEELTERIPVPFSNQSRVVAIKVGFQASGRDRHGELAPRL